MVPLWRQLTADGWVSGSEPHSIEDEEERLKARAELDAIVARDILGLTASEVSFVLEDFPTAAKYEIARWGTFRTRELILARFEEPESTSPAAPSTTERTERDIAAATPEDRLQ